MSGVEADVVLPSDPVDMSRELFTVVGVLNTESSGEDRGLPCSDTGLVLTHDSFPFGSSQLFTLLSSSFPTQTSDVSSLHSALSTDSKSGTLSRDFVGLDSVSPPLLKLSVFPTAFELVGNFPVLFLSDSSRPTSFLHWISFSTTCFSLILCTSSVFSLTNETSSIRVAHFGTDELSFLLLSLTGESERST